MYGALPGFAHGPVCSDDGHLSSYDKTVRPQRQIQLEGSSMLLVLFEYVLLAQNEQKVSCLSLPPEVLRVFASERVR